jgi:hypothetical protein
MMIIGNGLFDIQMTFYKNSLESEGIDLNEQSLLEYIRKKYSSCVTGTAKFLTIDIKKSIISLEDFPKDAIIYENLPHSTTRGSICNTKTPYSAEERILCENKCLWCNRILTDNDYKLVASVNENDLINHNPPTFIRKNAKHTTSRNIPTTTVFHNNASLGNRLLSKKVLVIMKGTVGSGKTTVSRLLQEEVEKIGGVCINESTDKYCKTGLHVKEAANRVNSVLRGISRINNDLIVVIIDTCGEGERYTGNSIFGYSFDGWEIHRITPNFDESKIRQYLCWSLYNVLNRPLHSASTNYWLNPESASVDICKKVHTDKAKALFGSKFVEVSKKRNFHDILHDIEKDAIEYQEYLNCNLPLESSVKNLIDLITNS